MALTNRQKSERRRQELNELAQAMGFDSWRKLETFLKRKFLDGLLRARKDKMTEQVVGLEWKPSR